MSVHPNAKNLTADMVRRLAKPNKRPRWPRVTRTNETCTIDDCDRPQQARGWCNVHYHRHRKYGSTDNPQPNYQPCAVDGCKRTTRFGKAPHCRKHADELARTGCIQAKPTKPAAKICEVAGCGTRSGRRDYCRKHQRRLDTYGSVHGKAVRRREVDPEGRFAKATKWGEPSSYAPELGPCLIYLGADNGNGYGQFHYNGGKGYAHRYAWERTNGKIPDGLTVDHLCRVRCCVNVEHMELVDGPTNTRRASAARTHCHKGHEYNSENTRMSGNKRRCMICTREGQSRSWRRRHPEKPHPNIKYDQAVVKSVIQSIRAAEMTIAQGAREIGCNPNYLGRRVWQETKKDVFARDKGCLLCGSVEQLDAHHRRARGSGGSSDPATSFGMANLMTLCRTHHQKTEEHPDWARQCGLRLDAGQIPSAVQVHALHGVVLLDDQGGLRPIGGDA